MNPPALLSRRAFLRSTALAAFASAGCATPTAQRSDHIDAHVHVWTPDLRRYPFASGFKAHNEDRVVEGFTPDQLFRQCRPQGVNRVLLIQMSFYRFDNRYLLDSIAAHPAAFRGIAIVDETKPDVCETMKALARQGIRGFRVYGDKEKHDGWSRSEGLKKMWSCAADEGLAICLLTDPGALSDVRKMCAAYPKTRVVIDHFGRVGMKGPIRQHDVDNLRRLSEFEHTHVKTSAFYALGAKKPPYTDLAPLIRTLRDSYGASRLMWGSDCPFQLQHHQTYAESISLIRDRLDFLTASDKEWMLRKTAGKLFFS
jgi:predicted TIM-barrel fold metal-dependent hydrolase